MKKIPLLIVGAGPAGLCAACEAARAGVRVTVIDENTRPGGQLFKQIHKFFGSEAHRAGTRGFRIGEDLLKETQSLGVDVHLGYPVYGIFPGGEVVYGSAEGAKHLTAEKIILATGACENNLAFEGSHLPGVMTAGAAQTLANLYRVLPGKRILMIGSGNVGLIVSYQLLQAGAEIEGIVEAAPAVGGYEVHANKLRRAGVPFYLSHTVKRVFGEREVEGAEIVSLGKDGPVSGTERRLTCDTVLMAVGLTPMTETASLAGCRLTQSPTLGGRVPLHDENMRTTSDDIYVAGDVAGVEEASTAMEEGRLAGLSAAVSLGAVSEDAAAPRRREIRKRLELLRSGPYGEARAKAVFAVEKDCLAWRGRVVPQ